MRLDRWIVLVLRVREVLLPEDYRGLPESLQIDVKIILQITELILQPCTFKMNFIGSNIMRVVELITGMNYTLNL